MNSDKLRIVTKEKELIFVDIRFIHFCKHFSKVLEDSSPTEDIPINIDSKIFKIIINFLENHNYQPIKEIPKPLQTNNIAKFVTEYDMQLLNSLSDDDLKDLTLACGYLDFVELLDMISAHMASKFIGKTWDEIKKEYEIPEEMTKEIIENMQKDYEYIYSDSKNI